MKSIGTIIPVSSDATSFYRAKGPLNHLEKKHSLYTSQELGQVDWSTVGRHKAVFMQRPSAGTHRAAFDLAKQSRCKLWLDYDDFLFDVPTDNPTYFNYMSQGVQDNVKYMVSNADIITVSTQELKDQYGKLNKNIIVVPNALDDGQMKMKVLGKQSKVISWRGSRTHHKDVFLYSPMISEVSNSEFAADFQWHFFGDNLWFLTDRMPHLKTFVHKPMDPTDYLNLLIRIRPTAMIVPLHDSVFNYAKSNIAWIEATLAGAACLGPDWAEWKRPGMITYKSREHFKDLLEALVKGEIDTEANAALSWEHIQMDLTLDKVNQLRSEVLCQLFDCEMKDLG